MVRLLFFPEYASTYLLCGDLENVTDSAHHKGGTVKQLPLYDWLNRKCAQMERQELGAAEHLMDGLDSISPTDLIHCI